MLLSVLAIGKQLFQPVRYRVPAGCKALLILWLALNSHYNVNAQTITITVEEQPLTRVFRQIERQTSYRFVFTREEMEKTAPVSARFKGAGIEEVLKACFEGQPVTYTIDGQVVMVKARVKEKEEVRPAGIHLRGKVIDEKGEGLMGVTVRVRNSSRAIATSADGSFELQDISPTAVLLISSVGYIEQEVGIAGRTTLVIQLRTYVGELDEVLMIAYGTTTRRYSTGSVARIGAEDIGKQAVANPLAALQGRLPGLVVTQSSGLPGASFKVQIRGRNSLAQGSDPLFIIDGVPFAPNNGMINKLSSILSLETTIGLSPFNSINPADIESIEVLKDADATAIYGSRGANGVVLITTRKGAAGRTRVSGQVYGGFSRVSEKMEMLSRRDYLAMRREAFFNDGVSPTLTTAPDLMAWDTTRYTDFAELLLGGTARNLDAGLSVSGGSEQTKFLLGGGYHRETTVFPGEMRDQRGSMNFNLQHFSGDNKFTVGLTGNFSYDENRLAKNNLALFLRQPANLPALYDSVGRLKWEEKGVAFDNPLAYVHNRYTATTDNLISHLQLGYEVARGLSIQSGFGYNGMNVREVSIVPKGAQNPRNNPVASAQYGDNQFRCWIVEPQVKFGRAISKGRMDALVGLTWQQTNNRSSFIAANNFPSDALLQSYSAGTVTDKRSSLSEYRYQALFGRITYRWQDRYIVNFSGRRDGSSRFGSGKQFASFGAAGVAWVFSNEGFLKKHRKVLSYGKLRGSYGSSGNDQIGDYRYMDAWATTLPYQGGTALIPQNLYNADYGWEVNRKLEGALELGFFKDRLLITSAYFYNRSGNQLIEYKLPSQSGFGGITDNFPATVQNRGWEWELTSRINIGKFELRNTINLTLPKNKLVSFPGIESSSYASTYVIGRPLNLIYAYRSLGVDPSTGVYKLDDINHDNKISAPGDYIVSGVLDPTYYGGFQQVAGYKNFDLTLFFEFRKQKGRNYLQSLYSNLSVPGTMFNQPTLVLDSWRNPGDVKEVQRYTALTSSAAYGVVNTLNFSDAVYGDASFIRLKTLALQYSLPPSVLDKLGLQSVRFFIQGQNLFTITDYKGADPEVQNLFSVPPLRTTVAGISITL